MCLLTQQLRRPLLLWPVGLDVQAAGRQTPHLLHPPQTCRYLQAQVLATDARATALRRLAVSSAPPLAREVDGAVGVHSFARFGRQQGVEAQQEVYRALWRDWGLQRIHVSHARAAVCCLFGSRTTVPCCCVPGSQNWQQRPCRHAPCSAEPAALPGPAPAPAPAFYCACAAGHAHRAQPAVRQAASGRL